MSGTDNNATAMLIRRLVDGQRLALARAITHIESGAGIAPQILGAIQSEVGDARVVGFTGAPGVGKSTLINAVIREFRRRKKTVAVAAVDPSSPISGGAILGDRVRMGEHGSDDGVFIRSISSRGHLGGLSATTAQVIDLMDAAGWDVIVIETVGAGQSEVEIAQIADVSVVVCAPGLGDDIQAIKAGILEIADVLVVNKADQPLADQTCRQLVAMLELRHADRREVPVLTTIATSGDGVERLVEAIEQQYQANVAPTHTRGPAKRFQYLIANAAARQLHERLAASTEEAMHDMCGRVSRGELSIDGAARALLAAMLK
jgi:LAO/AO transport system kinase